MLLTEKNHELLVMKLKLSLPSFTVAVTTWLTKYLFLDKDSKSGKNETAILSGIFLKNQTRAWDAEQPF
jgi:hypothetical protein